MHDGSRVPLTEQEAKDIHAAIQKTVAERAEKLPTTVSAMQAISEAVERLRELGWTTMGPKESETVACVQFTSTGMWEATRSGNYIMFDGCVSRLDPRNMMFKRLDKLTDDERGRIKECAERHRPW